MCLTKGLVPVHGGVPGGLFGGVFTHGGAVADDTAWLRSMLAAEAGLARALERAGLVPAGAGAAVTEAALGPAGGFDPARFDLAELSLSAELTGNPVPGLARALTRAVGSPAGKAAVHRGATSQDIMDTAAMLLARDAIDATLADLTAVADAAARLAGTHRATLMIGRTLLQQAVPTTFGVVAAGWLAGLDSAREWLAFVRGTRLAVQFGGAAGTLASLGDAGARVKSLLAEELGLAVPIGRLLSLDWQHSPAEYGPQARPSMYFVFDGGVLPDRARIVLQEDELDEFRFTSPADLGDFLSEPGLRRATAALAALSSDGARYLPHWPG